MAHLAAQYRSFSQPDGMFWVQVSPDTNNDDMMTAMEIIPMEYMVIDVMLTLCEMTEFGGNSESMKVMRIQIVISSQRM